MYMFHYLHSTLVCERKARYSRCRYRVCVCVCVPNTLSPRTPLAIRSAAYLQLSATIQIQMHIQFNEHSTKPTVIKWVKIYILAYTSMPD